MAIGSAILRASAIEIRTQGNEALTELGVNVSDAGHVIVRQKECGCPV